MRILVKGAGVAGLTVAHELVTRGAEITVIEKSPSVGGGASWLAGGMLAPFCERESAEPDVVRLGKDAARWWEAVLPGTVSFNGTLVVAPRRDAAELRRFAARTEGYAHLGAEEIAALEPDLAERFRTGLFFAAEAHLHPREALTLLQAKLEGRGVRFLFGRTEAPQGERFDRVVDCTGFAAASTLPGLRGVRGEMLTLETQDVTLYRPVRLIHPRFPVYIVPRGGGRFMVGATMIESADDGRVTARSMMELLNAAYALHPAFGEARILEAAAGVRPAFENNLPRIERLGGTLFVNGFHRHGFLLAPALAWQAAEMIISNEAPDNEAHRERASA
ncbi:glycine oxidase ThiO [Chelativorans sp. AA-79]|uniref:glycine oxidase ThiO n=1 Tax=Chelativorans sp. AA-79 TaxID=3028735 RepID=UPI0023F64404|nr:glycine oxidase ThiO [Chelativorans sp. AA-79]WEX08866.1 glycine oxidase ThiO [Chelativorans sp. AA-79]